MIASMNFLQPPTPPVTKKATKSVKKKGVVAPPEVKFTRDTLRKSAVPEIKTAKTLPDGITKSAFISNLKSKGLDVGTGARVGGNSIPESSLIFPSSRITDIAKATDTYLFGKKSKVDVSKVAPYASNLINSFRTPPKPVRPTMDSMISAQHVNMDNDRNMVSRVARGANANADATLDENTSQAVKQYNRATEINSLSTVNEKERNTNLQIDNDNARLNAGISASNNAKWDGYNAAKVERGIAQQREQSANIANAGDKYVGIQNEKAKQALDMEKERILATTDIYGTYGRNLTPEERKARGLKAMGGKIKSFNAKRMYPAMK